MIRVLEIAGLKDSRVKLAGNETPLNVFGETFHSHWSTARAEDERPFWDVYVC